MKSSTIEKRKKEDHQHPIFQKGYVILIKSTDEKGVINEGPNERNEYRVLIPEEKKMIASKRMELSINAEQLNLKNDDLDIVSETKQNRKIKKHYSKGM